MNFKIISMEKQSGIKNNRGEKRIDKITNHGMKNT